MLSCEIYEMFKKTYSEEHLQKAASDQSYVGMTMKCNRWNPSKRSPQPEVNLNHFL